MTSEDGIPLACSTLKRNRKHREEDMLKRLQMDHLNSEESLQKICSDYQDMFYLPGYKLSYMNEMKYCINLAPETTPGHEVNKQVTNLLREDVIEESGSPWNSPILLAPKKIGTNGEPKWQLKNFRKVNKKTV
jgi:hypothetical protein